MLGNERLNKILPGKAMTKAKGHEPMLYEAPFFRFMYVKMKGPNKPLNIKRTLNLEFIVNSYFINPVFMLNKSFESQILICGPKLLLWSHLS